MKDHRSGFLIYPKCIARHAGGMGILTYRTFAALFTGQVSLRDFGEQLYAMGVQSLPLVLVTSVLSGVVTSQQGYKALLREAAVEMKKGNVVSEQPVEIILPNGTLKANRLEIVDSGAAAPVCLSAAVTRWHACRRVRR